MGLLNPMKGVGDMRRENEDRDIHSDDLDSYVEKELLRHYGSNVMHNSVQPKMSSAPYKKIHGRGFFSLMSIVCAALFLTGVGVTAGVLFSSGVPVNGTASESVSSRIVQSMAVISSSKIVSGSTDISSSEIVSKSTDISSSEIVSKSTDISSSEIVSKSTDISSEIVSSSTDISSSEIVSGSTDISSSEIVSKSTDVSSSEIVSSHTDVSSSEIVSSSTDNIRSRPDYYSLPEPSSVEIATGDATDDNAARNPNDTVTTGKKIRAGMGNVLILMSLVSAVWLYKLKESEDRLQ